MSFAHGITVAEDQNPAGSDNVIFNGAGPSAPIQFPHPAIDLDEDWVWRNHIGITMTGLTKAAPLPTGSDPDLYQSRAQRRLKQGQGLIYTFAPYVGDPNETFSLFDVYFSLEIRMLFKVGETPPR